MIPLHELLSRIYWNPEFGRGDFQNQWGQLPYSFEHISARLQS